MQFKVPQFIEIESKILGNFTFKQVIYIGGGLGFSFVVFKFLSSIFAFPLILVIGSFSMALTFYPKQKLGKPFIEITESAFKYMVKSKLYVWRRTEKERKAGVTEDLVAPILSIPKISKGGLQNVSKNIETRNIE